MAVKQKRVAIVYPADERAQQQTTLEQSRFAAVAEALSAAGAEVIGTPYADQFASTVREQLLNVGGVLVWYNPIEGGRDRTALNAILREVATHGAFVSTHPDVIDKIGTKEVLYRTRRMEWGSDTRLYNSLDEMRASLALALVGGPRVLKQLRGQSGDGIWKVSLAAKHQQPSSGLSMEAEIIVRHAKRGSAEERMPFGQFLTLCRPYFTPTGAMIDQPYQARIVDGMVRCYVVKDKVQGFGEQLINALYPAPVDAPLGEPPQPGPRLYYPSTRPDFQDLKGKLEVDWIPELCDLVGIASSDLPVLWDADFLYGPKDEQGDDTYVLCEINVSSVFPFPPSALDPLVAETMARMSR